jgi:raffinose/stachyose/melibiose transport system permease protein
MIFVGKIFYKQYSRFPFITIAVIPSIAVFALFQEQVVSNLVAGAVKE